MRSGVDCHGAADQADVQTTFRVDQAGDGGLVRGEEVLQANLLGPLAAFIHNDAVKQEERQDELLRHRASVCQFFFLNRADIATIASIDQWRGDVFHGK